MTKTQQEAAAHGWEDVKVRDRRKEFSTIAAVTIGNGLEFFEFTVYAFFATIISKLYFAGGGDDTKAILITFATFGVAFGMRPLGAIFIGRYADRVGRRAAMMLTLSLMGVGSLIIVFTPTYAQIGIVAPILILIARLAHGFALGGEIGASNSILMEYADNHNRGYYGGWQPFSQNLSSLLGSLSGLLLTNILSPEALEQWGWRVPFALGILIIPVGLYIRRNLHETADVQNVAEMGTLELFSKKYFKKFIASTMLIVGSTASIYVVIYYLPNYAKLNLGIPLSEAMWAGFAASLVAVIMSPISGILSDKVGRKPVIIGGMLSLIIVVYPLFSWLVDNPSTKNLVVVASILAFFVGMIGTPVLVFMTEVFPRNLRATGLSLSYCIGVMIFGGFAAFFITLIIDITGNMKAPALYMMACGLIQLVGVSLLEETAGKDIG